MMREAIAFHKHLDSCDHCMDNPFNLCQEGRELFRQSASAMGLDTSAIIKMGPAIQAVADELNLPKDPRALRPTHHRIADVKRRSN